MTLSDWASVAEIIGSIAVVISLVFVGLQIRKNTESEQANTLQTSVGADVEMLTAWGSTEEGAYLISQYILDPSPLTEKQIIQARYLFAGGLRHWENLYLQYTVGAISEDTWQARVKAVNTTLLSKGYQEFQKSFLGNYMSGDFLRYAEKIITENQSPT